jgi:predicted nucleic acid-binding protein
MKVLIDTNVILDFVLNRTPFADDTAILFLHIEQQTFHASVSASAVTDIFYLLKKEGIDAIAFMKDIFTAIDVLSVDKAIILSALYSDWADFEDAVQSHTAIENEVDIIIIRNTKDFKPLGQLKIMNPKTFIETFNFSGL